MERFSLTDEQLKDAVNAAVILDDMDDSIEQQDTDDFAFSEDFQKCFDGLLCEIDQEELKKEQAETRKKVHFRRSFMIAVAVLTSLLAVITASADWNRWLSLKETSTDVALKWEKRSPTTVEQETSAWQYVYLPAELPEGYVELDRIVQTSQIIIMYGKDPADTDAVITYLQFSELDYLSVDNEGAEVSDVFVGEHSGTLVQKGNEKVLFWNNGELAFCISAQIPTPDLMYFAEHLEKTKIV